MGPGGAGNLQPGSGVGRVEGVRGGLALGSRRVNGATYEFNF